MPKITNATQATFYRVIDTTSRQLRHLVDISVLLLIQTK